MTERFLLAVSATLSSVNGVLVGAVSSGLYDVPNLVLLVAAVTSIGVGAFVAAFMRA